jgi:mRNA-degrading endonuclease RelE of RelBE toxin-antitoxin system
MELVFLDAFYKDIKKIKDSKIRKRLKSTLISLEETTDVFNSKLLVKMKGHPEAFRVRLGVYRLGCYVKNESQITIARFVKRNDIYKVFP